MKRTTNVLTTLMLAVALLMSSVTIYAQSNDAKVDLYEGAMHFVCIEPGELMRACPAELLDDMQSIRGTDIEHCYDTALLMQFLADAVLNGYEVYVAYFNVPMFYDESNGREWWHGPLWVRAILAQHMVSWTMSNGIYNTQLNGSSWLFRRNGNPIEGRVIDRSLVPHQSFSTTFLLAPATSWYETSISFHQSGQSTGFSMRLTTLWPQWYA